MIQIALSKLLFDRDAVFQQQALTQDTQAGIMDGIRANPGFARERIEAVVADINDQVGKGDSPDPIVILDADRALTLYARACEGQAEAQHFAFAVASFLRGAYIKAHALRAWEALTPAQRHQASDPSKIVVNY
jgi:hypothetical protein